ncbi:MAG: VWA domain-containing protein [Acidobacteria bacterium]|nr:VWA domain-containing protein [Acidobacteriota bacterium]
MVYKKLVLSLFLLLSLFTLAFAQNDSPQPPQTPQDEDKTIRIDTELIQLDVIVTDKNGHVVNSLKQEDFEIIEDGKKQSISFFSYVKPQILDDKPQNKTKLEQKTNIDVASIEQSGRIFIVLVDDLHISPSSMLNVKKQLLTLIDSQIQDGDRVAVVTTGGGLGFLQQLTDERKVYRKAIEKLIGRQQSASLPGDPAMLTDYQAQKINDGEQEALDLGVENYIRNIGIPIPIETARNTVRTSARQIVEIIGFQTTATLQTIRNSILAVKSIPGRKTMILVSDGFLLETREADHLAQMRRIVDSATKSGVVVYSLGSAGLTVGNSNSPFSVENTAIDSRGIGISLSGREQFSSLVAMQAIAQDTGGFSVINNNNLLSGLQNIVTESSSYYLLAYYPEDSTKDGKFREIKVNIKGDKKLIVKSGKGYFSGEEKIDPKELAKKQEKAAKNKKNEADPVTSELISSISSVLPVTNIGLKMKADFLGTVDNTNNTVLSFAIDLRDIKVIKSDNKYTNKLKALLILVGEDGKIAHSTTNTVDINFPEARYEDISKSYFFYAQSLALKPGFYNVRFALRDPLTSRLGSVSGWVEVPNLEKSKMALSNILLLHEQDHAQASPNSNGEKGVTGTGQALTIFSEKSSLGFLSYIFNAKSNNLTAQIQIIKANKALFTSPQINVTEKADASGRIAYGGSVPLTGFPSGDYRLKITITDSKNKLETFQEQRFTIEK